jgi:putative membrane protein
MWPYMGSMGGWMALWWVAGIAILVLLVRLVTGSTRGFSRRDDETPEQILKRRYAKGEIDSEEYQHRLADLRR